MRRAHRLDSEVKNTISTMALSVTQDDFEGQHYLSGDEPAFWKSSIAPNLTLSNGWAISDPDDPFLSESAKLQTGCTTSAFVGIYKEIRVKGKAKAISFVEDLPTYLTSELCCERCASR